MKLRVALFAAFVATVLAANWALNRYGIVSIGFGLMAPAGVYFAGLGFTLRDALHEAAGKWWVVAAIVVGAVLSYVLEDAVKIPGGHVSIAVASGAAFLLAELADLAVYTPLRERQWTAAVIVSGLVGAVVDSVLFLWLAFGSLDHLNGQVVGKTHMVLLALPIAWYFRQPEGGPMIVTASMQMVKLCPYVDEVDVGSITFTWDREAPDLHAVAAAVSGYRDVRATHEFVTETLALEFDATVESSWTTAGMSVTCRAVR